MRVQKMHMNVLTHYTCKLYCFIVCTLVVFSSQAEKSLSKQTIASISMTDGFPKAHISAQNQCETIHSHILTHCNLLSLSLKNSLFSQLGSFSFSCHVHNVLADTQKIKTQELLLSTYKYCIIVHIRYN